MPKAEADAKPAGQGRDDPNKNPTLEEPKYVFKQPNCRNFSVFVDIRWRRTTSLPLEKQNCSFFLCLCRG